MSTLEVVLTIMTFVNTIVLTYVLGVLIENERKRNTGDNR